MDAAGRADRPGPRRRAGARPPAADADGVPRLRRRRLRPLAHPAARGGGRLPDLQPGQPDRPPPAAAPQHGHRARSWSARPACRHSSTSGSTSDNTRVDLDVMFIGTAGSAPTARRGLPATLVRRGGDRLLFDCGEGTQRQLLRSIGLVDLEEIFLTHFHADHFLGLPGMLKTFGLRGREAPLTIYGPPGLRALFEVLRPVIGGDGVRGQARRARAERPARARRLPRRAVPGRPPRHAAYGYVLRRAGPPGPLRRGRARASSGVAAGPGLRPPPARRGRDASTAARCCRRRCWGRRAAGASSC